MKHAADQAVRAYSIIINCDLLTELRSFLFFFFGVGLVLSYLCTDHEDAEQARAYVIELLFLLF